MPHSILISNNSNLEVQRGEQQRTRRNKVCPTYLFIAIFHISFTIYIYICKHMMIIYIYIYMCIFTYSHLHAQKIVANRWRGCISWAVVRPDILCQLERDPCTALLQGMGGLREHKSKTKTEFKQKSRCQIEFLL